jgi:PAS domain S-box-containing protein
VTLIDGTPVRERVPWQRVLEALDEVVLLLNERSVVTYASPSVAVRLGHAPRDLAGRPLGDVVHPDDLRTALRGLAEVAVSGVVHVPMRLCRADGGHVRLECSLTRAAGPDGTGDVIVLCGHDGTARARLEERLAAADRRYRALLAALGEAVVFLDAQLRVEEVNARAAALLGRSAEDILGRAWFDGVDVWDENGRPVTPDGPFARSLLTDPAPHEVWRSVLRPDGQRTLLRNRWTPMGGEGGSLRGYVVTLQDAMGPKAMPSLPQQRRQARTAAGLTPREHEVLERLADGQDAMEIARELGLSVYSVRGHIKSLMRKLKVHSQLQAVVVAARRGIVDVVGGGNSRLA